MRTRTLPEFVMMQSKTDKMQPKVLQTTPPYLIGSTITVKADDTEKFESYMRKMVNGELNMVRVPGYSIFLLASGSLAHQRYTQEEAHEILRDMALYFKEEMADRYPGYKEMKTD